MMLSEVYQMPEVFRLTDLEIEEVSLVELGANNKKFVTRKGENGIGNLWFMGDNMVEKKDGEKTVEKTAEEIEKELKDRLEKEMRAEIEKEYAEKLKTEKAGMTAEIEKANKLASDALKVAEVEKAARLNKEFIDVAKGMPTLGDASKVGPILKEMSEKLSTETYTAAIAMLKTADERMKKSMLLEEIGKDGAGEVSSSAYGEIEKAAKGIAEAEKIAYGLALEKAIKLNPKLYEKYQAERAKRT